MFFNREKKKKENIRKIILASLGLLGVVGIANLLNNKKKGDLTDALGKQASTNLQGPKNNYRKSGGFDPFRDNYENMEAQRLLQERIAKYLRENPHLIIKKN